MNEFFKKTKDKTTEFWVNRSKTQKTTLVGSIALVLLLIIILPILLISTNYVPLYNNLSVQEVGQIKEELDARSIPYKVEDGGETIKVPEEQADALIVDLAGEGIPDSGSIDYSFFSENASWGVTDSEFDIMKLDAMQTELANLIKGIEGVEDAKVMINMPEEPVFVSEETEPATASIVLHTEPNYKFEAGEITALNHLVSKALPNLPPENIAIMNQYFEYYDIDNKDQSFAGASYSDQQSIKQDIEQDLQRRAQQLLGAMVGMENVIVSVTSDVDFTQENRNEELVEPFDEDNMEGLPVSIETIQETYQGNPDVGGVVGTGEEDIPGYEAVETDDGEYELVKETINNEFNRIQKEIVESPYKLRDVGIQVAVNSAVGKDEDDNIEYLNQADQNVVEEGIESILNSIITTSIDKEYGEITPEEKVSIVFQEFSGDTVSEEEPKGGIPVWLYVVGGIILIAVIVLAIVIIRRRAQENVENEEEYYEDETVETAEIPIEIPEIQEEKISEAVARRKQLEKLAQDKPDEFTKILRSWMGED